MQNLIAENFGRKIQQKWFRLSQKARSCWMKAAKQLKELGQTGKVVFGGREHYDHLIKECRIHHQLLVGYHLYRTNYFHFNANLLSAQNQTRGSRRMARYWRSHSLPEYKANLSSNHSKLIK